MSRRDFLRISGGTVGAGLALWMLRPGTASARVLPPGALAAEAFTAACLRCGRCTAVCDQRAIQVDVFGEPYVDGISGWCDFCELCVETCPSGALTPFEPDTVVMGTAVIDRDRCIAWLRVGCRLCAEKCDKLQQAIWIDEDLNPHVDEKLCNGCGACVFVCPQAAQMAGNRKRGKAISLQEVIRH